MEDAIEVTDPLEMQRMQAFILPSAPPTGKKRGGFNGDTGARAATSADDRKELMKWSGLSDDADKLDRAAAAFNGRIDRFHPSPAKSLAFSAMYPDPDGMTGLIKAPVAAALRGTIGWAWPQQDHDDYQFLSSRASAINNAALRLEKGVQTKSDEVRVARENVGLDKTGAVNRDIIHASDANVAIAHARNLAESRWVGTFGSLSGTRNRNGDTFEQWFQHRVKPDALARISAAKQAPSKGGWAITKE